jgi:hypothetical protein
MAEFSRGKIETMLDALQPAAVVEVPESSRITVHAAISRFSFLYERIRNAVDYRDEHLLRKAAIVRIFKRQLALEHDPAVIGVQLVRELIAARYLPNATLPDTLTQEVSKVVAKYQAVVRTKLTDEKHRSWLVGIVAAELEELIDPHRSEKRLTHFLFEALGDRIQLENIAMDETERRLQVYIACHRSLFRHDDEMVGYKLVRAHYRAWMNPETWTDHPEDMALQMVGIQSRVERELRHPLAPKFLHAVKPWSIALSVTRDALLEAGDRKKELLEKPAELHAAVDRIADRRLAESKKKLRRGTIRAMVYLFVTKIVIALATEIPLEVWLYARVHLFALSINVLFPPLLMLLVGRLIRMPGKENNKRIWECVEELLSPEGARGTTIRVAKPRTGSARFVFSLVYAATFLLTFGLIAFLLSLLSFTWISSLIFIFFLCLVSFFGYRLRVSARQYVVVAQRDKMRNMVLDFFFLPILRAGQWLSRSVSRLNIFVVLLDFIIEAPYKIFLNILEDWFGFMKEKKEELQ